MEILVLHPGALGDIILSLPALEVLGGAFPHARITMAANADFAETVASGYADRILSLSALPLHRLHGDQPLTTDDKDLWLAYDRILSWTGSRSGQFVRRLEGIHPCALVAPWRPEPGETRHVSRIFVDSLRPWCPIPALMPLPRVRPPVRGVLAAADWLRARGLADGTPIMALHPGAGSSAKRRPPESFVRLGRRLQLLGRLLIIEGPAEPGLGRQLASDLGEGALLAADLPLHLLAAILFHSRLLVGNDSGISHLAAALGVPCLVLFGPTQPQHWAPLGEVVMITGGEQIVNCQDPRS